jgi:hypothetical protein
MTYATFNAEDPLDLEVEPGVKVRDLNTPEKCATAKMELDMEIETIASQIRHSEANPGHRPSGWRARAQGALRWKKRIRRAIVAYAPTLSGPRTGVDDRQRTILDTIRTEIGDDEFDRLVALAKARHPHLAWGTP